jgi:hypothetical protein
MQGVQELRGPPAQPHYHSRSAIGQTREQTGPRVPASAGRVQTVGDAELIGPKGASRVSKSRIVRPRRNPEKPFVFGQKRIV